MDRITTKLLEQFSKEYNLESKPEDQRFEHFCAFATTRRHYDRTFLPSDIVVGAGDDLGIDAIAVIVNNVLVTDVDMVEELADQNGYIDAVFVFVQATRSQQFDGARITNLSAGIIDFFSDPPRLPRNALVQDMARIAAAVYDRSTIFRKRPSCMCYYVTTGKWRNDQSLDARRNISIEDLERPAIFDGIEFHCFGADEIQKAYNQTRNPISREFRFSNKTDIPQMQGVRQAFLGFVPVGEFKKIISDESGNEILASIFEGNVRDWQEYTSVNDAIRKTLVSDAKSRFVLMNNGVTIIARAMKSVSNLFTIEDFQIVNGCQTSHVVFNEKDLDDSVCIPLRLIETRDEEIIESIIHATNNQSPLRPEQLYALLSFSKKLEDYFQTFQWPHTLYYERRDGQYERRGIEKTRITGPTDAIRAFSAMFLNEPHRTTRSYKALRDRVGSDIYGEEHRLEPYYAASFALYRLKWLFRNDGRFPTKYKPAAYHILLTFRLLVNPERLPPMNSHEMERRANEIIERLWSDQSDDVFLSALQTVNEITGDKSDDRDFVRQKPTTDRLLTRFGLRAGTV